MQSNPDRTTLAAKAAVSAQSGALAPEASEILALMVSTGIAFILFWGGVYSVANFFIPLMMGVVGSWGIWQLIRRSPANVWTPLFAIRASAVVFLGIGGLVTELGSEVTRDAVLSLYAYSPEEGAKTNTIFIAGYFLTIASVKLASILRPLPPPSATRTIVFTQKATLRLGLLFLAIGFGYTFLIQLPLLLNRSSLVLPGTLALLFSALSAVGTFLVALWAVERRGISYLLLAVLLLIQLVISLVLLEKNAVMTALLLVGIAFLLHKVSIYRIAGLAIALGALLSFLSPAVTQGRVIHAQIYGDLDGGSLPERLGYSLEYIGGYRIPLPGDESSSFVRLHYVSPSAFAVTQYDVGLGSDIIANGFSALIPRALWPDKPVISDIGTDFNEMISGSNTSALGVVVFADAYWNFGWPGLLIFIPAGFFLWWASRNARAIVETRDWIMMPFVLITFRIGMSVDNFLILSWLTPAVIAVMLLFVLRFAKHGILATLKSSLASGAPVHDQPDRLGAPKG
jgi:hypothetical protein